MCIRDRDATNVLEVAEGIMTLLTDENLGNMGKQGSTFSREKFVWEKRENTLVEVIENLV